MVFLLEVTKATKQCTQHMSGRTSPPSRCISQATKVIASAHEGDENGLQVSQHYISAKDRQDCSIFFEGEASNSVAKIA